MQKRAVSEGVFKYQYQFQNNLNAWSRFKDSCVKKGCFREQFLKTTSETALFWRILHELDDDYFQIKQNKERKKCIQNRLKVSCEHFKWVLWNHKDCRAQSSTLTCNEVIYSNKHTAKFYFQLLNSIKTEPQPEQSQS